MTMTIAAGTKQPVLTRDENAVLGFLESKLGKVVTRNEIQEALWPEQQEMSPSAVDKHISAVRRKLGEKASIVTFYGAGYILIRKTWTQPLI